MKRFKAVPGKGIVASTAANKQYVRASDNGGFTTEELLEALEDRGIDTTVHRYVGTNFTSGYGEITNKFSAPGDYCAIIYTMRRPFEPKIDDLASWLQEEKWCDTIDDVFKTFGMSLDEAIDRVTGYDEGVVDLLDMDTGTYVIE